MNFNILVSPVFFWMAIVIFYFWKIFSHDALGVFLYGPVIIFNNIMSCWKHFYTALENNKFSEEKVLILELSNVPW